ncbi:MAG TPA: GtrA family protein [Methanosarcina sp.]|nr:GtrA family protein [Methanosarcina sp.]
MILTNTRERTRFLRFAVVGTIGAIIDFGIFNLLISGFSLASVIAGAVSFTLAVASNFIFNRYWTYPDSRSRRVSHQLSMFFVVSIIGLAIRTFVFFTLLEPQLIGFFRRMSIQSKLSPDFLGHNLTLALAIVVVMFWNFFANRYWTYSDVE